MAEEFAIQKTSDDLISVEQHRAIQEVQAALIIAKRFPRDQDAAYLRIMKACDRYSLAEQAEYAYPKGGKSVTGPSIRLAEVIMQNWGNANFGIRELSHSREESEVEAFAWDLETNLKQTKTFSVPHKRYTKAKGNVSLSDPRDIYELTANQGARRMRACMLGIVPGDIVEAAIAKCRETVRKGIGEKPLIDQIRATLKAFDGLGITKDLIEKRLGHGTDTIIEDELIELNNIGRSIKDNITTREEWFDVKTERQTATNEDLTSKIKNANSEETPQVETETRKTEESETPKQQLPETIEELYKGGRRTSIGNSQEYIDKYNQVTPDQWAIANKIDPKLKLRIQNKVSKAERFILEEKPKEIEVGFETDPGLDPNLKAQVDRVHLETILSDERKRIGHELFYRELQDRYQVDSWTQLSDELLDDALEYFKGIEAA